MEPMKDVLPDSTDRKNMSNYDDSDRFRIPATVRGYPGFIEYRGMPWMKNIMEAR